MFKVFQKGHYIVVADNSGVLVMALTNILNLVIFGMILYVGLIVVPSLMENKEAH